MSIEKAREDLELEYHGLNAYERRHIVQKIEALAREVAREEIARASAGGGVSTAFNQGAEYITSPAQAPETGDLPERLERGATKSPDYGMHLNKYQALCDEAAKALRTATARIRELKGERDTARFAQSEEHFSRQTAENTTNLVTEALADIRERVRAEADAALGGRTWAECLGYVHAILALLTAPSLRVDDLPAKDWDEFKPRDTDTPAPAPDMSGVRLAGQKLANMAFNLAQQSYLPEDWRKSLRDGHREWDAALSALADAKGGKSDG